MAGSFHEGVEQAVMQLLQTADQLSVSIIAKEGTK